MHLHPPFRLATAADGPVLARFIMWAGEGLPMLIWQDLAGPGGDPWAIGAARMAAKAEAGEVVVADRAGAAVAGLIGYPIHRAEAAEGIPPRFVPLQELENLAVGSWYINVLATVPEARGQGWGGRLIALAEAIAADAGHDASTIIVSDANHGARRLYERCGYREVARRRAVKEGWENPVTDWVLLRKRLT
ncbi:N-acetyltransferase [Acuticoccus sp. I52.16.1]|uniref:GNAT family N-acetyltransferase n=1 Tax=Acuticoccus sp. I52.16.1 TaxID=2928472 RepID=UPI001FD02527|nr:GNAT family N-acetyltransferase [Acuticoccus sp. I52.16.1]UOM33733.1 GNAT family N-acetyltransferase [Acuticoccus sp. I52.16.1]